MSIQTEVKVGTEPAQPKTTGEPQDPHFVTAEVASTPTPEPATPTMAEPRWAPPLGVTDSPVTVGRIVHFHDTVHGHVETYAAIVIRAWSGTCADLKVFGTAGEYNVPSVSKSTSYGQSGAWSYPPRV